MARCVRAHAVAIALLGAVAVPAGGQGPPPWPTVLPPVPTAANPQPQPRPGCKTPSVACVDKDLRRLRALQRRLRCDHRQVFATTYLTMTHTLRGALAAESPRFTDSGWIISIDGIFHRYYYNAYSAYARGDAVPHSWRLAFRTAARGDANATKDLLLGANAHVQRDLPYVLATVGLRQPDGVSRKPDWDLMSEVLDRAYPAIVRALTSRLDRSVRVTNPNTRIDRRSARELFAIWRERAWRHAEALLNATTRSQRAVVRRAIEANANRTARQIARLPDRPGYRRVRDRYCRSRSVA